MGITAFNRMRREKAKKEALALAKQALEAPIEDSTQAEVESSEESTKKAKTKKTK